MTVSAEPVFAHQAAFRALMDAVARPGTIRTVQGASAPAPLATATAALVESLADHETPVWLDATLRAAPEVADWIKFRTGARIARAPDEAGFALIADPLALPDFARFALGSEEYPDRSATLIVQVARFAGPVLTLQGPGIRGTCSIAAEPLPEDFAGRLAANRALFPRGIDLVLVAGERIVALPRSVRIVQES